MHESVFSFTLKLSNILVHYGKKNTSFAFSNNCQRSKCIGAIYSTLNYWVKCFYEMVKIFNMVQISLTLGFCLNFVLLKLTPNFEHFHNVTHFSTIKKTTNKITCNLLAIKRVGLNYSIMKV